MQLKNHFHTSGRCSNVERICPEFRSTTHAEEALLVHHLDELAQSFLVSSSCAADHDITGHIKTAALKMDHESLSKYNEASAALRFAYTTMSYFG